MRISYNLITTIEVPDAEIFPPKEEVEKSMIEFFKSEGMIVHRLDVTNYVVLADKEETE